MVRIFWIFSAKASFSAMSRSRLLLGFGAPLPVRLGEVRFEDRPPAVVQLRPFHRTEDGAALRQAPFIDQGTMQILRVAPLQEAEEVVDPLLGDGMIAGEVLHGRIALLPRDLVEEHRGRQRRLPSLLVHVVERGEPFGGVLLEPVSGSIS